MERRKLLFIFLFALVFIAVSFLPVLPCTPTRSWWVVTNTEDSYNKIAAEIIAEKFGCQVVDWNEHRNYNAFMQSLFIVGGSSRVVHEAQWLERNLQIITPMTIYPLEISKPLWSPDVFFTKEGDYFKLYSPNYIYTCSNDADYGFITINYAGMNKWVVGIIGYSGECTICGAIIATQNPHLLRQHRYIIYKLTSAPSDPTRTELYQWTIVEVG